MKRISQLLRHRSLTLSFVTLFGALLATTFLPEHAYRLQQHGATYLRPAAIIATLGFSVSVFTLIRLLKDTAGYPSHRCSIATLLWALGSVPILLLCLTVISALRVVSL
jgi:hypothetical protein